MATTQGLVVFFVKPLGAEINSDAYLRGDSMRTAAVILAAGQSTRMRSKSPKVLHPLLGRPIISYALESTTLATGSTPVLVIGHGAEQVRQIVGDAAHYVVQEPQLGTGHAVQQAEQMLKGNADIVLVTYADMPLIKSTTFQQMITLQQDNSGSISMMTVQGEDPRGFGRVTRADDGSITAIVEEADATPEQLHVREFNVGVYCFQGAWLWEALKRIPLSPKGEYYLTDLVKIAVDDGQEIKSYSPQDPNEAIGINNRVHLSEVSAIMKAEINQNWMLSGVTIVDPATTFIDHGIEIGQDTVIWPNTYITGYSRIGESSVIGPDAFIQDTSIGDRCKVWYAVLEGAQLEDEVELGPFGHLRKGAHLAHGVHMGNFGEVKNSYLGPGTKMGHFSYVGDTTTGADVNIGAGTVTCNYDGERKHPTEIGAGAFIGSDTMLVAPVKVGEGARTGAGAVVTRDVPENTLAVGAPARSIKRLQKSE